MTNEQVIRCAYADLVGAKQAFEQGDMHLHNWSAHSETISELEETFPFLVDDEGDN